MSRTIFHLFGIWNVCVSVCMCVCVCTSRMPLKIAQGTVLEENSDLFCDWVNGQMMPGWRGNKFYLVAKTAKKYQLSKVGYKVRKLRMAVLIVTKGFIWIVLDFDVKYLRYVKWGVSALGTCGIHVKSRRGGSIPCFVVCVCVCVVNLFLDVEFY